jgi:hypothetical protein
MPEYFAITIWQPWASLIQCGAKRVEFRNHPPHAGIVGARVAIHAGKRPVNTREVHAMLDKLNSRHAPEMGLDIKPAAELLYRVLEHPGILPLSSILCTVVIGAPLRNAELAAHLGIAFVNDSERDEHSNWGWPLSDVLKVEPMIPATGRQGWWKCLIPEGAEAHGR